MTRGIGLVASTIAACGLAFAVALPAAAADNPPESGDDRATAFPGNAVTCEDAGLAGEVIEGVRYQADEDFTHLVITFIPDGYEVTGAVIKGGDAYNVYPPQDLTGLHAPLNNGGQIPQISHWYVCGQDKGTTTSPTSTTTSSTSTSSSASSPTNPGPTTSDDVEPTSTTSTAPGGGNGAIGGGDSGSDLAATGFDSRGLMVAGGGLLLIGTGLVLGMRASRRRSNG